MLKFFVSRLSIVFWNQVENPIAIHNFNIGIESDMNFFSLSKTGARSAPRNLNRIRQVPQIRTIESHLSRLMILSTPSHVFLYVHELRYHRFSLIWSQLIPVHRFLLNSIPFQTCINLLIVEVLESWRLADLICIRSYLYAEQLLL